MASDGVRRRAFSDEFDDRFPVGVEPGNTAFFGQNVLRGLIDGIDDFIHLRQQRWSRYRGDSTALLGSAMVIDDPEFIHKIGELHAACIVVTKQDRDHFIDRLAKLNERTPGMPIRAFSELTELAPKEDGKPALLGPSSPVHSGKIPTIRTLGFRKVSGVDSPPLLHAKMALLGNLWWHDEDESGHVVDVIGFEASRLWISSANFTYASRHHLEFGYWTEDPALIGGAKRFLVELMRSSEALDPESDFFDPELVSVEYDDEAMVQAMTEISQGDMAIEDWYYDG